ncbi:hypothetical protein, partial [Phyllobacterium leguminum]|uniref:hypothetical protein n=1 Tax=Phyllobacterium leguminum TaxID=314237 RepID=UPI001AED0DCA
IKFHNRMLESSAVPGHEKPPKVDIQLSGVSSAMPGFLVVGILPRDQGPSLVFSCSSLME